MQQTQSQLTYFAHEWLLLPARERVRGSITHPAHPPPHRPRRRRCSWSAEVRSGCHWHWSWTIAAWSVLSWIATPPLRDIRRRTSPTARSMELYRRLGIADDLHRMLVTAASRRRQHDPVSVAIEAKRVGAWLAGRGSGRDRKRDLARMVCTRSPTDYTRPRGHCLSIAHAEALARPTTAMLHNCLNRGYNVPSINCCKK